MEKLATAIRYHARTGLRALALTLLALVLLVVAATAHALLARSDPEDGAVLEQPPAQVTAWYSQELDTGRSTLQVFDVEGRQVDNGDGSVDLNDPDHASLLVSLPASLPDGTYLVHWAAVSAEDGDPTEGEFTFSVGERGKATGQISASTMSSVRQPSGEAADTAAGTLAGGPVGWTAAGLGVLLLVVGGLTLRRRLA